MLQDLCHYDLYHPDDNAIQYKNMVLSYGRLDELLHQCRPALPYDSCSTVILIVMNKGIELILATLSVFFSNHVFCIIDVNTTQDGFSHMIRETNANVVFTDSKQFKKLCPMASKCGIHIVQFQFDESGGCLSVKREGALIPTSKLERNEDISHIIYTSGSTAAPKGILCSRTALWHFIQWEYAYLQVKEKPHVSQMSAPWFEPFLRDVFLPLFCGGCICIPTKREEFDPKAFENFIREKKIDVLHIVPTMFRHLFLSSVTVEHSIAHILLAGEMLYATDVDQYYGRYQNATLYNLYGPSETTMAKFCYQIARDGKRNDDSAVRVKVGKPLPGTTFWLVNETGESVAAQEPGEVVICTKDGSYGYCNREITKKSFAFSADGSTVFQTGDIGKVHDDGNLELLGRRDFMRKIYGQKVYPEEIESAINQYSKVKKCMVFIEENKIIAVLEVEKDFSITVLSALVNRCLVPYKRPHYIYVVDRISVNKSGKLDRKYIQKISDIPYTKKYMI